MGAASNAVLGVAAVASVALAENASAALWTAGVPGFLVALLAGLRASHARAAVDSRPWGFVALGNVALGAWIVAGALLAGAEGVFLASSLGIGLLVMLLAGSGAWSSFTTGARRRATRPRTGA